ncbi:Melatonin receptor type 1A [Trichoplax sp. H2]|nr:Melatonin receptor type 1A [Trichoplax sp. H2]|eukprot:RDD39864.1 Melatonin receptor type 1A [Trichoplax sp. H2]
MDVNSTTDYNISTPVAVIFIIYMSIATVIGVIGNIMALMVIYHQSSLHNTAGILMANLAVADLLITIFNMPATMVSLISSRWPLGSINCQFSGFMMTFATGVSLFTLAVISIDRCKSIIKPLRYQQHYPFRQYIALISLLWLFPCLMATMPLLGLQSISLGKYQYLDSKAYCWIAVDQHRPNLGYVSLVMLSMTAALAIFTTCYFMIYRSAKKSYALIASLTQLCEINRQKFKSNLKTASTLSVIVGVFMFCWSPLVLIDIVSIFAQEPFYNVVSIAALRLALSNSAYNPIIYGIFNQSFRKGFKNIMIHCCLLMKRKHSNEVKQFYAEARGADIKSEIRRKTTIQYSIHIDNNICNNLRVK